MIIFSTVKIFYTNCKKNLHFIYSLISLFSDFQQYMTLASFSYVYL